jgi:hypothetical protein
MIGEEEIGVKVIIIWGFARYYCVHGSAPPAIFIFSFFGAPHQPNSKHRISSINHRFLQRRQQYTAASPVDHLNLSYLPPLSIPQQAASPESL